MLGTESSAFIRSLEFLDLRRQARAATHPGTSSMVEPGSTQWPRYSLAGTESRRVVAAALAGNLLVTATKLAAAFITGSSAMFSEAVHTAADTGNELLLLYGL